MIIDRQSTFSNSQAVTATVRSTNVIDLQAMGIPFGNTEAPIRDMGKSDCVSILMQVTETFNNLTSLTIELQTSDDPAFGSGNVTHSTTGAVLLASLVAGWRNPVRMMPEGNMKRYMSLLYTVAGTAPTAGKIHAGIVEGIQTNG